MNKYTIKSHECYDLLKKEVVFPPALQKLGREVLPCLHNDKDVVFNSKNIMKYVDKKFGVYETIFQGDDSKTKQLEARNKQL